MKLINSPTQLVKSATDNQVVTNQLIRLSLISWKLIRKRGCLRIVVQEARGPTKQILVMSDYAP